MRAFVWLSFDLGVQGDYEGLYEFLDRHKAKECGDSLACFSYETEDKLPDALTSDIRAAISVTAKTRIYIIWMVGVKVKGRFIIGQRRNPPWTGYASSDEQETDSDEQAD